MLLSRFWYGVLSIAVAALLAGMFLATSIYNSAGRHATDQALAADTQVVQTVSAPSEAGGVTRFDPVQAYKISIYNPGASDLTVKLMTTEEDLGGADRDCLLDTLSVPASATVTGTAVNAYEFLTGGIFCGGDLKIVVSNDDSIGEAAGFTATLRIREV